MTTDLTALWHTNRRWRSWMDANTKFVTPAKKLVTLRYMDGETREVRDLIIRQEQPDHARNNGRDSTIEQELADVVMLALTALNESPKSPRWQRTEFHIDYLCDHANEAVMDFIEDEGAPQFWQSAVHRVIENVLAYPGLDLPTELDRCWRRLADKHGWEVWAEWAGCQTHQDRIRFHARLIGNPTSVPAPWLVEETAS